MSVHEAWRLACRLFASGRPARTSLMTPSDKAALSTLGKAVMRVPVDGGDVLCPYCGQCNVPVLAAPGGRRVGRCMDCGSVEIPPEQFHAYVLDDQWMHRNLRLALDIESRDGVDELAEGVWRLGNARQFPVVLARDLTRIWRAPGQLNRIRVAGQPVRLITPLQRNVYGMPLGYGVEWLPLEERFALYGGGITTVGIESSIRLAEPVALADPTAPVHGPFSKDFRWVTVPEIQKEPIPLTKTQGAVFEALWSFKGRPQVGTQIMTRAGSKSDKPGDVFKNKKYDLAKQVFKSLVQVNEREGLYRMACAR